MLGTRLGPYEILSLIGSGGMGDVYVARDTRLDRRVAVKVLAPELAADPAFRDRFTREARAISLLDHPHICRLFDIGHQDETQFLVLELVEGESLSARLQRGQLPIREVLRFAVQIAAALEAAHAQGIIHRDLKPANVMLTPAGVKLVDFGLAKTIPGLAEPSALQSAPPTATAEGTIIGTLQYMSPEQIQGHKLDARSDIFALGAVVYEMATGRRAFAGETQASVIAKILEAESPPVSSLSPQAPPDLNPLVQGCLAKSPADRWQTAHDVGMQLQWIETQVSRANLNAQAPLALSRRGAAWIPWAIATVAVVLSAALQVWPRPDAKHPPRLRFDFVVPPHMWQLDYNQGRFPRMVSGSFSRRPWTADLNWCYGRWPPANWSSSQEPRWRSALFGPRTAALSRFFIRTVISKPFLSRVDGHAPSLGSSIPRPSTCPAHGPLA